ncbi:MAG: class I poly(R)-hydroxyalkanoic acid synthase [Spongiibacteraceae bacterium]
MIESTEELLEQLKAGFGNEDLAAYLDRFSEQFNELISRGVLNQFKTGQFDAGVTESLQSEFARLTNPAEMWEKLSQSATLDPARLFEHQMGFMQQQSKLWQQTALDMLGVAPSKDGDVIKPQPGDARFRDADWNGNPVFRHLKQAYLLNAKLLFDLTDNVEFKDEKTARQAKFLMRQFANSLSPSNFISTNPEVCRAIVESKGKNLYDGLKNFLADLKSSPENALTITMADSSAFTYGDNIAMTPGKVVFRNDLMELIQYSPQTETVFRTPVLIVPALINKYYIFDLSKKASLVDWMVKQGLTVFIISWINPDASLGHLRLEDYMEHGVLTARTVMTEITGEEDVNAVAYCIGGTLLASIQAWLTARDLRPFKSTTYFTTLLDFSDPGELSIYVTDEFISSVENNPMSTQIVDGRKIMLAFSLMRENNLYWSFFINNYLLGRDPAPFDLLHWNSDATNLPMATFSFYLRNMYLHNRLIEPGAVQLAETPIDLGSIAAPSYFLSTFSDHIAPWEGGYRGMLHHGGDRRFVLAGSGHIAGVMNPPSANKYGYWTNGTLVAEPQEWLGAATQHEGSWWLDWLAWVAVRAGEQVLARQPGSYNHPVLEDAPGRYIHIKAA